MIMYAENEVEGLCTYHGLGSILVMYCQASASSSCYVLTSYTLRIRNRACKVPK